MSKAELRALKAAEFEIANEKERERFAFALLECLASPDPELRDKIAYEAYVALMRGENLDAEVVRRLGGELIVILQKEESDPNGFEKPFAALVLAEVARTDRVGDTLNDEGRQALVDAAAAYLTFVTDYRGFDDTEGWRHGVAHTADLAMQLAFNTKTSAAQLQNLRDAVMVQIIPDTTHFYIYGEPARLARPILVMAMNEAFTEEEWAAWFAALADPAPLENWGEAYESKRGLARLHNLKAFGQAVYVNADASENEKLKVLVAPALELLRALP
ncbi:MAG: DUF2785 domain-containing protein [Pseudomonadota bacterium]